LSFIVYENEFGCHAHRYVRRAAGLSACAGFLLLALLTLAAQAPAQEKAKDDKAPDKDGPLPMAGKVKKITEDLSEAPSSIPPAAQDYLIDLDAALRLAEVENPRIGIGRQAIQAALAEQLRAQAMLLPTLRAGTNYHLHDGVLQSSFGLMRRVNETAFYVGSGARTLAAETVAFPGVQLYSHLGDAIFEPLAARRLVSAAQARSVAIANTTLLDVAVRYLELVRAEADLAAVRQSEVDLNQVVQITAAYAETKQGRPADALRARTDALLLHNERQMQEENVVVAASELSRLLNLDPAVRLWTPSDAIGIVQLVDPNARPEELVQQAFAARPELAALRAEIARKQVQIKQEKCRPFFPTLSVGYSAGGFTGSTNLTNLVPVEPHMGPRTDFDVIAYWTLQNAGMGNVARTRIRTAERNEAQLELTRTFNEIGRDVVQQYNFSEARYREVEIARQRLKTAERGFQQDLTRIKGAAGLPIEVLNSMRLLTRARLALIEATFAYDVAQFRLFVALGQPPPASQ
jgi:outer membrane protein TolC